MTAALDPPGTRTIVDFTVVGTPVAQGSMIVQRGRVRHSDWGIALSKLRALIGKEAQPERMLFFSDPNPPVAKSRARWSAKSRRFYTPDATENAEELMAYQFKNVIKSQPLTGSVAIIAIFYRPNYQRIDVDNLMKLVMDAATKAGVWRDDCFCVAQAAFMELDRENPRTVVAFCPATSSLDRSERFTCRTCGKRFNRAGVAAFRKPPQFCSKECRYGPMRQAKLHPGKGIGRKGQPPTPCKDCGTSLSARSYIRCRSCWVKARKAGIS